jgi:polysaccharide pyruvyl transferase CsaB
VSAGTAVCGFYGRDNLGDEAILAGMCDALAEARPDEQVLVLSADPAGTSADHGVPATHYLASAAVRRGVRRQAALSRALLSRDRFVLGGGDLIRDSPTQEVVRAWLDPLQAAQRLRRRTAVVGISVGDLFKPESRERVRRALDQVDFVVTREETSRQRLLDLDVQTSVEVAPDLALRVATPVPRQPDPGRAPRVLVSVRGLADRAGGEASREHEQAMVQLARTLDALHEQGAAIELVPLRSKAHALQPVDDDYVVSLELAHRATHGHRFHVHRHVPTVGDLRLLFAGADLVMGMRLHAVIIATGMRVPFLALSYDAKVTQFCTDVGLDGDCQPLAELSAAGMLRAAEAVLARRVDDPGTARPRGR